MAKIGRNDPCDCGSGLKYKKCHGGPSAGAAAQPPFAAANIVEAHRAAENIRQTQQGLGRPIVGSKVGASLTVADVIWPTFPLPLTRGKKYDSPILTRE
jgi:SEC-C motif